MVPTVLVLVVLGIAFAAVLGGLAQGFAARTRAATAADAAALAAAPVTFRPFGSSGDPAAEARKFAAEHGAEVVECRCLVDTGYGIRRVDVRVSVVVDVILLGSRRFEAASSAEFDPVALLLGP